MSYIDMTVNGVRYNFFRNKNVVIAADDESGEWKSVVHFRETADEKVRDIYEKLITPTKEITR